MALSGWTHHTNLLHDQGGVEWSGVEWSGVGWGGDETAGEQHNSAGQEAN